MGWREVLVGVRQQMNGQRVTVLMSETRDEADLRAADAGVAYLMSRPPADRIALARELLEGTGRVVSWEMGKRDRNAQAAWNTARSAMLEDPK